MKMVEEEMKVNGSEQKEQDHRKQVSHLLHRSSRQSNRLVTPPSRSKLLLLVFHVLELSTTSQPGSDVSSGKGLDPVLWSSSFRYGEGSRRLTQGRQEELWRKSRATDCSVQL
ncbi:unnamed protein product [Pleuronectes platessa]|uniref:Uncharacterized protein n=1 Tax=Pleuronectes platessa TaxID=8262 RepID=A0A9N7TRN7_PLEPL|nr:unnamed protein product [Pleuronectes platessa]